MYGASISLLARFFYLSKFISVLVKSRRMPAHALGFESNVTFVAATNMSCSSCFPVQAKSLGYGKLAPRKLTALETMLLVCARAMYVDPNPN